MHRVDTKKRRSLILRYTAYSVTLILSVVTTVVLLFVAQGYRLDSKSGSVIRSGLLLVNNTPEAGTVYINGELKDASTPSRFVLKGGQYELSLERSGYRGWKKQVAIVASGVEEVYYPLLLPTTLTTRTLTTVPTPTLTSQSLDRKLVLIYVAGEEQLHLLQLDDKAPKLTTLTLPTNVRRENNQLGTLKVIEWALDNKHVLLQQTLPSGTTQLLSLDVTQPSEIVNITNLYGDQTPTDVHYIGGKTNEIYGLKDSLLNAYQLGTIEQKQLMKGVRSYKPFSDDTIAFARVSTSGTRVESGVWLDGKSTVIRSIALHDGADFANYGEYDSHFYFAVATGNAKDVIIYRDPLKTPILTTQLPYAILRSDIPTKLDFSSGSQFLLAETGQNMSVYDFEHVVGISYTLPFLPKADPELKWVDNWHLLATQSDGTAILYEYDGANQQKLLTSSNNSSVWFANNYQHIYRLSDKDGKTQLDTASLVVNKQ